MIVMSRNPQDADKIQAQSIPELKDEFQVLAKRLGRKVSFRGRKMGAGPLLNAIVINYLSMSAEKQIEIAKAGIARYEALLEFDEPVADLGLADLSAGVSVDTVEYPVPVRPGRLLKADGENAPVVAKNRAPSRKK